MPRIAADVTWLIGRTPLVELARLSPPGRRFVAKLEALQPSGSNKDRAALAMIEEAERQGALAAGGTIVECSCGDLGLAIALIGRRRGYRVVLTMPAAPAAPRAALLQALGAELVLTEPAAGMRGAMQQADVLAKQTPGAVCLQAFTNRANSRCHALATAREIWADTDGSVAAVVAPIGTGGTAAGCAEFLRQHSVPVFGVEPAGSPVLTGGRAGQHAIPGLGAGFIPEILTPGELTRILQVSDDDAAAATRSLLREECLLVGPASGAVLQAARRLSSAECRGDGPIVLILPDSAERYLDHPALQPEHR